MESFNKDYFYPLANTSILNFENIYVTFDETETSKVVQFAITSKVNNQEYHIKGNLAISNA